MFIGIGLTIHEKVFGSYGGASGGGAGGNPYSSLTFETGIYTRKALVGQDVGDLVAIYQVGLQQADNGALII